MSGMKSALTSPCPILGGDGCSVSTCIGVECRHLQSVYFFHGGSMYWCDYRNSSEKETVSSLKKIVAYKEFEDKITKVMMQNVVDNLLVKSKNG